MLFRSTTRKSTTHNRYMNYSDYLCHHTNDDLEAGRMIIYDFEKKKQAETVNMD